MTAEKHTEQIEFWHRGLPYVAYVESPIVDYTVPDGLALTGDGEITQIVRQDCIIDDEMQYNAIAGEWPDEPTFYEAARRATGYDVLDSTELLTDPEPKIRNIIKIYDDCGECNTHIIGRGQHGQILKLLNRKEVV